MRKIINHNENIGKKFNKLLVLNVKKKTYGKARQTWAYYYECKCDCGTIKDVRADYIVNGQIKSCGCYHNEYYGSDKSRLNAYIMGCKNRKHEEVCDYCGEKSHYANGLCRNCYSRLRHNGSLEYKRKKYDRKSNKTN